MRNLIAGFFLFLCFMAYLTRGNLHVMSLVVVPMAIIFSIICIIMYFVAPVQMQNRMKKTNFCFDDDWVSMTLDYSNIDILSRIGDDLVQARYGIKPQQHIPIAAIYQTLVNEDGITIIANDANPFNGNGKIFIPKEVEHYEELLEKVMENKLKYKLRDQPATGPNRPRIINK